MQVKCKGMVLFCAPPLFPTYLRGLGKGINDTLFILTSYFNILNHEGRHSAVAQTVQFGEGAAAIDAWF